MIKSMTGFGRCEITEDNRKILVEVKSVNHRYLDVNMKMPKKLGMFESAIRGLLKEYIQRGKVDLFITYEDFNEENFSLTYNESLAAEYVGYCRQMAEKFGIANDLSVSSLARFPEVFVMEQQEADEEKLWTILKKAVCGACEQFVAARETEGENLRQDLIHKLDTLVTYVDYIEERSPRMLAQYREKLEAKVAEILADTKIDEARIATEVTIFADKVCVDEEMVRLRSHIQAMKDALTSGGSVGRKLDFITQELNREANTILSKANDLEISDMGINLKTDIEKIREQIQNIE